MPQNSISAQLSNLQQLVADLEAIENGGKKAISNTIKDVKARATGWIAQEVTAVYNIKKSEITPSGSGKPEKMAGSIQITGETIEELAITYKGRLLTPVHFGMTPKAPPRGKSYTLKASVLKGQKKVIGRYADALRLLCQPERSAGAGCTYSLMYYEKQSRYHAKDPKPGDQIFFSTAHSKSNVSHTGLVEKVDGSKVYTIEGNTSDQVARRSYYLSDNYIVGYGRPAYDAEPGNANTGSQTPSGGTTSEVTYTVVAGDTLSKIAAKYGTTYQKLAAYNGITNPNIIRVGQKIKIPGTAAPKKTIAEIAKEVIAGKWGNGADRKRRLEAAGYDYNAIQQAVNAALAR